MDVKEEILRLYALGYSGYAIAKLLHCSTSTPFYTCYPEKKKQADKKYAKANTDTHSN